jgi:hypothetical protein
VTYLDELQEWLEESWDPSLTLREWWRLLADANWSQPHWPIEWYGRGLSLSDASMVARTIREFGAVAGPPSIATRLAGPTLLVHGSEDQKRKHLRGIADGSDAYCQLFSEPNAGSDLAGLQCKAERDGDDWIVNGQKVWTSHGQIASKALLLARTNPDVPKHAGISYFILRMDQPGVEFRPLREMTGRSFFNEVFLTNARVSNEELVGGVDNGWDVANTTLSVEREISGGIELSSTVVAGKIAGNLDRAVGSFSSAGKTNAPVTVKESPSERLIRVARRHGRSGEAIIRDRLATLYSMERLIALNSQRQRDYSATGRSFEGAPNLAKVAENQAVRFARDLSFTILGSEGGVHRYDENNASEGAVPWDPDANELVETSLFSFAPPIMGGTDQIQHNILGERTLGLPREASADKGLPFRELPKN